MSPLKKLIIDEITAAGPMRVDRYMQLCLTHPEYGYYMKKDPFGAKGDFTTAPEISQIFGEMIGLWCAGKWQEFGKPEKCAIVELGPGRGTLMADLLRGIRNISGFQPEVHLVEISPKLKEMQRETLKNYEIHWHENFPALDILSFIVANEFFDALPIRQFIGEKERMITTDGMNLHFNIHPESALVRETSEIGNEIMAQISAAAGAGIIIDYGYINGEKGDSLQAVREHSYASILDKPGEVDLTAHVNFQELTKSSRKPTSLYTQREFLLRYGADVRAKILKRENDLARLIEPQQMGDLFKVLCF